MLVATLVFSLLPTFITRVGAAQIVQSTVSLNPNGGKDIHWKLKSGYKKITFKPRGGKLSASKSVKIIKANKKIGTLPKPTKTGYKFKGWYTAKSGGIKLTTSTVITRANTFYAQWLKNGQATTKRMVETGYYVPVATYSGYGQVFGIRLQCYDGTWWDVEDFEALMQYIDDALAADPTGAIASGYAEASWDYGLGPIYSYGAYWHITSRRYEVSPSDHPTKTKREVTTGGTWVYKGLDKTIPKSLYEWVPKNNYTEYW